jgi:hypothetical protein
MTAKLTPPFESINAEYCVNHEIFFGASLKCLLVLMLIPYSFASSYVTIATTEYPPLYRPVPG